MKTCSKCHIDKPLDEFHKCSRNKDGKDTICIICVNTSKQVRYNEKKENYNAYKRKYHNDHKEIQKKSSHKWYEENKEEILTGWKVLRDKNPKIHRKQNTKYYNKNKQKVMFRNNANTKKRLQNDSMFRITKNLRGRINTVLKGQTKSAKTLKLLGCSLLIFKEYLKKQFRDGMTWKNYGNVWHIDHVKPCSKFNLLLAEEQQKCFHYTNLQPLLAIENLQKYNKIIC
jgi:hypothetical protein